jgi:hypothetical protein
MKWGRGACPLNGDRECVFTDFADVSLADPAVRISDIERLPHPASQNSEYVLGASFRQGKLQTGFVRLDKYQIHASASTQRLLADQRTT